MKKCNPGGVATAIKLRKQALSGYYENPNTCLLCSEIIHVGNSQKVCEVRKKKFCNKSCAAKYNNHKKPKRIKKTIPKNKKNNLTNKTKKELFEKCKNYFSARSTITKNARYIYKKNVKNPKCIVCGYDKHIHVAHIIAVMSFSDDDLISEINSVENLTALCPNHHWEYDNNLLNINDFLRKY